MPNLMEDGLVDCLKKVAPKLDLFAAVARLLNSCLLVADLAPRASASASRVGLSPAESSPSPIVRWLHKVTLIRSWVPLQCRQQMSMYLRSDAALVCKGPRAQ